MSLLPSLLHITLTAVSVLLFTRDMVLSGTTATLSQTLDRLFANSTYDKRVRPHADEGMPTNVTVRLKINSINSIDEVDMICHQAAAASKSTVRQGGAIYWIAQQSDLSTGDIGQVTGGQAGWRHLLNSTRSFSLNMYLRVWWTDERLRHNLTSSILLNQISGHLTWLPDLFFANEEQNGEESSYKSNQYERIYPDGKIFMSKSVSGTFSCHMDIRLYPVDNQTCYIKIESYGHNTKEINFHWYNDGDAILIPDNLLVTEFSITDRSATHCDTVLTTGSFPCLKANFHFMRMSGVYLMNAYLPAVLVVIMSWIAFWLNVTAIAARISIGLLTVLTMTTQTTSIISDLPRVPYIKAIEIWMCVCLVFVFVAFLETALAFVFENEGRKQEEEKRRMTLTTISKTSLIRDPSELSLSQLPNSYPVNRYLRRNSNRILKSTGSDEVNSTASVENSVSLRQTSFVERMNRCAYPKGKSVDRFSRVCFPVAFAIFNIIYWIICYTK